MVWCGVVALPHFWINHHTNMAGKHSLLLAAWAAHAGMRGRARPLAYEPWQWRCCACSLPLHSLWRPVAVPGCSRADLGSGRSTVAVLSHEDCLVSGGSTSAVFPLNQGRLRFCNLNLVILQMKPCVIVRSENVSVGLPSVGCDVQECLAQISMPTLRSTSFVGAQRAVYVGHVLGECGHSST